MTRKSGPSCCAWLLVAAISGCVEQVDLRSPSSDASGSDQPDAAAAPDAAGARDAAGAPDAAPGSMDAAAADTGGAAHSDTGSAGSFDAEGHDAIAAGGEDAAAHDAEAADSGVSPCAQEGHECVENLEVPGTCPANRDSFALGCWNEQLACCGPAR